MMTSSSDELLRRGVEPVVVIEHLRVVRGKRPAIHDLSVQIARGTITGLLGPSGCGKTTLMRSIVGTQILTAGSVTVLGQPAGSAPLRRRVGYMPQEATIYDDLRIVDNVRYFASLYGMGASDADQAVSTVGLDDHRTALCSNLSGGQRTRVSLACALVAAPDLLVLDEPTIGLDPVLRVELWEQFHQLARHGTTLLVSSHVMDEADHCGDLLLMREGHLLSPQLTNEVTRGHGMSVTGGSVSVRHPAQHRSRSRLSPLSYVATTGRILRQLAADHRSVAMILVVPSLIITLMYFMFQNAPHRPGTSVPVQQRLSDHARGVPLDHHVPDHVDNHAAGTGFGDVGADPDHAPASTRPAGRLRHRVLDRRGSAGNAGVRRVVLVPWPRHHGQPHPGVHHRDHQRDTRCRAGPAVQRFRPHRVPGRAVHACRDRAATAAVRHHRAPRCFTRLAAMGQQCAARQLRSGGATAGRRISGPDGNRVAGHRRGDRLCGASPCASPLRRYDEGHRKSFDDQHRAQTSRATARDVRHSRTDPHQCSRAVRPQRDRQDIDSRHRSRCRRGPRAGTPLLRHQDAIVRRGDPYPDRPDGGDRPAAGSPRRTDRLHAAVDPVAAVGFRAGQGFHRDTAVDPGR